MKRSKGSGGPGKPGEGVSQNGTRSTGRVRLEDVAKLAGVGRMSVSRALNNPAAVSDKLRARINKAVDSLGYVRDNHAAALASGGTRLIPVMIPTLHHSVYVPFLDGLYSVLKSNN